MDNNIHVIIDGKDIFLRDEITILKAAEMVGISIPTICFHEACTANALCRICVVKIEGLRKLVPACVAKVKNNMVVITENEEIIKYRKTILEMMASANNLSESESLQKMIRKYDANPSRFEDDPSRDYPVIDDNSMFIRDYSKCILCWRCIQACAEDAQYAYAINFSNRGYETKIDTFYHKALPETTCVFCGQCIGVCPTGALKPKKEWLLEQAFDPDEIMSLTWPKRNKNTETKAGGTK